MEHISLDYEDFEKLVKGKVIERQGVKIALQDIGWHNMVDIVESAWFADND